MEISVHPTDIVRQAIKNTIETMPTHWQELCASRSKGNAKQAGSYFHFDEKRVGGFIQELEWEHYTHSSIKEPATGFIARSVFGTMNVVSIQDRCMVPSTKIIFEDPKSTGKVEGVTEDPDIVGIRTEFAVLLVGPSPLNNEQNVVYTFHPGDPIPPSTVERYFEFFNPDTSRFERVDRHGTSTTAIMAKEMGVQWVKVRSLRN